MKYLITTIITLSILACSPRQHDPNDMGTVDYLPKGQYMIQNTGSRHMVRCVRTDGKIYWLNDADFKWNGIAARDAHEFHDPTPITIR